MPSKEGGGVTHLFQRCKNASPQPGMEHGFLHILCNSISKREQHAGPPQPTSWLTISSIFDTPVSVLISPVAIARGMDSRVWLCMLERGGLWQRVSYGTVPHLRVEDQIQSLFYPSICYVKCQSKFLYILGFSLKKSVGRGETCETFILSVRRRYYYYYCH